MKNIFLVFGVAASMSGFILSAMEAPKKESVDQEAGKEVDLKKRAKVAMGQFLLPPELVEQVLSFVSHGMAKEQAGDWARCAVVNKEFNTLAHAWLPGNLQESGEYTLFKQVMKLRTIAAEVAQKSLAAGAIDRSILSEAPFPEPDPCSLQTHKGIFLKMGNYYPDGVATPWGKINLYVGGARGRLTAFNMLTASFLQTIATTFYSIPYLPVHSLRLYYAMPLSVVLLSPDILPQAQHQIPREPFRSPTPEVLATYRGKRVIIYADKGAFTGLYSIHEIKGKKVETPVEKSDKSQYRPKGCALMLWKTLKNMYINEHIFWRSEMVRSLINF